MSQNHVSSDSGKSFKKDFIIFLQFKSLNSRSRFSNLKVQCANNQSQSLGNQGNIFIQLTEVVEIYNHVPNSLSIKNRLPSNELIQNNELNIQHAGFYQKATTSEPIIYNLTRYTLTSALRPGRTAKQKKKDLGRLAEKVDVGPRQNAPVKMILSLS